MSAILSCIGGAMAFLGAVFALTKGWSFCWGLMVIGLLLIVINALVQYIVRSNPTNKKGN